ncbi:MAG: NAD-dependent epimerase/dehydratase family protein, partial [Flavobacteriales bacterium]|nr:NAD-dependent epimerase/dehydratase family protein [Flavobacteriales bacterium]
PYIMEQTVLITGATGYIGSLLIDHIVRENEQIKIIALGRKDCPSKLNHPRVKYFKTDIRSNAVKEIVEQNEPDIVVHLAAVVNPGKDNTRELAYDIDVNATASLLKACTSAEVKKFIYLSSGAVYGYHPDHPEWIHEDWPIRGNKEYPYAYHKKLAEEILVAYQKSHPQMEQLILRVPAVLGEETDSQITDLLNKNPMITVGRSDCPFVFIWDKDLVRCIYNGILGSGKGVFNIAGDGKLSVFEMAKISNRKVLNFPTWLMRLIMGTGKTLGLTKNGAEVVSFVLYRPVLANKKMKEELEFIPEKTSKETFEYYLKHQE